MTSPTENRTYLDWNATAPLRPEAREAMLAAMDAVGNPSSAHAEGRAAKAIMEKARGQVARLVGCEPGEVVFTSGATEAMALAVVQFARFEAAPIEHECVCAYASSDLTVSANGHVQQPVPKDSETLVAIQAASGETGIIQPLHLWDDSTNNLVDAAQALGKTAFRLDDVNWAFCLIAPQKFGGPRGVGSLVVKSGLDVQPLLKGGGQEMRRRSGTENLIGIAGFGAAAQAALRDLESEVWDRVAELRDRLEERLEAEAPDLIVFGHDAPRLPNTSYFAIPGWKGETQVMQMDLAGFAVSAGSACSSGKVGSSRVLLAMGFDETTASSAIRVSMGATTTEAEVMAFADTWIEYYRRRKARAA